MADLKYCKKYDSCNWRASVGYCPDSCNHFKHRDEEIVVRCRDCSNEWCYLRMGMGPDGFCSAAVRRDNG